MTSRRATPQPGTEPAFQPGVRPAAVWLLMLAAFGISAAYGMLLLLPLFVVDLGGSEADFGLVLSSAAVTAVIALVTLTRYPEALRPHLVLALAIAVFGIGSAAATLVTGGWEPLVGVGVLLGTAWAVVYAVAPMVISAMVTDSGRTAYFGYLTGSEQLGIGAGPILAGALLKTSLGFRGTFAVAALICVLAVVCTLVVGRLTRDGRSNRATGRGEGRDPAPIGISQATRRIARSQTALWLFVIMLFACLFTTMTQFQTTFAAAQDLDYSIFYIAYTIAVIAVRFTVAPWAARYNATWVIAVSITVMTLGLAAFLVVGASSVAYAAASAVLGLGYGLSLPAVQAHAVNVTAEEVRPRVLPIAGLVFQAAILSFPLAVGWMVVTYGYQMLFTVLIALATVQIGASWSQVLRHRG